MSHIEWRNRWLAEALDLSAQEALRLRVHAEEQFPAHTDPVRRYLYEICTNPPAALPVCEMCDAAMDRTTLCYCADCMDRHADDVAEERALEKANALEKPEALEKALAEAQRLTHELARVVAERDLLRETLANTTPKTRKPRAKKEKNDA